MSVHTYKELISKAKTCQNNVKKNYELGISYRWSYYFAKAIINPKTDIKKGTFNDCKNPIGTYISRQISKADYLDIAKRYVAYIEKNKRFPNYATYKDYQIRPRLLTIFFANILVSYDKNGKLPVEMNINSKCFTKPTETGNAVYDYFVKKTGKKPKTMDEVLEYVCNYFHYQGYFDDQKSNKQVMDSKSGNCVDLLQWLINMLKPLGYDGKCIHVECRKSGTGHVFGKFRHKKNTENKWVTRDPAAVCQNSIRNVWCDDGYLLAENPSWFMSNLNR